MPGAKRLCQQLARDGGWQQLTGCDAPTSASKLERDVASIIGLRATQLPQFPRGERAFKPALACLDLSILYFFEIALLCFERRNREALFWPALGTVQNNIALQCLATNLGNALLGTRTLLLSGLAAEARLVLRGFVEVADLTVAVACDSTIFQQYLNADEDPDQSAKYWRRFLSPARCRDVLTQHDERLGADAALRHTMRSWRREMYSWLSRFAHSHPVAHFINSHSFADGGGVALGPAWAGIRDDRVRRTMKKAASYSWLTSRQLGALLAGVDHGWYALSIKNDSERSWIAYHWEFMNRYFFTRFMPWSESVGD